METHHPTAAVLVIGNEILSGRTHDKNLHFLAGALTEVGVPMREGRIVPDVPQEIIEAVNALRARYTYVFTTGGIGPTHDDITSRCIAEAFGAAFERNAVAEAILRDYYSEEQINEARLSMADMPEGVRLIPNPVSGAPGFIKENVYVLAGVPSICRAMFEHIRDALQGGPPVLSRSLSTFLKEGQLAEGIGRIQLECPEVEIGSYPFIRQDKLGVSLVVRGQNARLLDDVIEKIQVLISDLGGDVL